MKTCTKCGETKPTNEFHKDKSKRDGFYSSCKSCVLKRLQQPECRKRARELKRSERYRSVRRAHRRTEAARAKESLRKESPAYRAKLKARSAVNRAVRSGKIPPPQDVRCSEESEDCHGEHEYHHDNYLPGHELSVRCLCKHHHDLWHRHNKALVPTCPNEQRAP